MKDGLYFKAGPNNYLLVEEDYWRLWYSDDFILRGFWSKWQGRTRGLTRLYSVTGEEKHRLKIPVEYLT